MRAVHVHHSCSFLTIDEALKLLLRVSTQLHLYKRAGDAAARLGEVSGSNNLQEHTDGSAVGPWNAAEPLVTARTLTSMMYLSLFFSCSGSKLSERMTSGCST